MAKATESALSELHGAVARTLTAVVSKQEEVIEYDAEGEEVHTGAMEYTVSPAMMAASIKFLKDNSITCDIEQSNNMGQLREALARKQKHSRLADPKEAATKLQAVS